MAEPPHKRARRPDSKQMWDESDRRVLLPSRERDEPRDRDRKDDRDKDRKGRDKDRGNREKHRDKERLDRDRERDRRYRSRSPRDGRESKTGKNRDGDYGGRRGDLDLNDAGRSGKHKDEDRSGVKGSGYRDYGRDSKDVARKRSRSRDRDRRRSRSPRRDRDDDRDSKSKYRHSKKDKEVENPVLKPAEEEFTKSRTETPPVSFKVGRGASYEAQDHDRMDTDDDMKPAKVKGGKSKKTKEPSPEEDDDIVVEDDGMTAMQAMMGFGGFGTTQNKQVPGNNVSAVRKEKKTEYRQYMNRVGGFNRPLSPSHD